MLRRTLPPVLAMLATAVLTLPAAAQSDGGRIRIENADELPRHTYPVPESATRLVEDDAQFAALAAKLVADLRADLEKYEIADRATLKTYYNTLGTLAMLAHDHDTSLAYADSIRLIEDKPALQALAGTFERALAAAARASEHDPEKAFEHAYRREIAALPYDVVQAELKSLKGMVEITSTGFLMGIVQGLVEPAARSGEISRELAETVVRARLYLKVLQPIQDETVLVLAEAIAANVTEKPDIWSGRDVALDDKDGLTPVVVSIWDSGVDTELFAGRLFVNTNEIPDNGLDDDGNGFVDDVHGIAYDLDANRTTDLLIPLTYGSDEEANYRRHLKGFMDLRSGIDSRDASELRQIFAGIDQNEFQPFIEGFTQYANHAHGTHVAGIAVAGNPAARILIGRLTFDHRLVPVLPTIELIRAGATQFRETVEYFRTHGVRVVNMSWVFMPQHFERVFEAHNVGGSADERKALARRYYDIVADALRGAIEEAPDILFVAAAGNWDDDNRFVDSAPASFDLPNLITAAAVDRAGDEAAFTSYGKVEIYANGYEVESFLPGGERSALSGTSMAAPQVANLAAKLLAVHPDLTVAQLRAAILEGADERVIGEGKRIMLLNPRRSFEKAAGTGVTPD